MALKTLLGTFFSYQETRKFTVVHHLLQTLRLLYFILSTLSNWYQVYELRASVQL